MSQLLLATKLYVPQPGKYQVARPGLLARLDEGLQPGCRLILLSAPAGYGKTSLVSAWLASLAGRKTDRVQAAWLTLDDSDNDPVRFCSYLISALYSACPGLREPDQAGRAFQVALQSALQTSKPPDLEGILATLINDLAASPQRAVLVLDDYHVILAPAIHTLLAFLVDHLPPQVRLMVLTRVDPGLPLARLRGRGQVLELRLNELRFSTEEAGLFLNAHMGLGLSPQAVDALNAKAEGWPACLQMAAASLKGCAQPEAFIATFSGSHRYILDYLIEEVLGRQPAPIQAFLEQTSLLETLCGPLCAAVLDAPGAGAGLEVQSTLEYLESANLFLIPLDDERCWYRYHHLFADLLRKRLGQSAGRQVGELHRRASQWYAANGHTGPAIDHALRAPDFAQAARLLEGTAEDLWGRGDHEWLLQRMAQLPAETLHANPRLGVMQAAILAAQGNLNQAEHCLQAVEHGPLAQAGAGQPDGWLVGRIAAVRTQIAVYRGDNTAGLAYSRQALANLPDDRDFASRFILLSMSGNLHTANQDLPAATRDLRAALEAARLAHQPLMMIDAMTQLAMTLWIGGYIRQASTLCQQALRFIQENGLEHVPATNILWFAWGFLLANQRRLDAAQDAIQRGLALCGSGSYPWAVMWGRLALLYLALARNDLVAAQDIVQQAEAEVVEHETPIWIACGFAGLKALTWVRLGRLADAEAYLNGRGIQVEGQIDHPHLGEYSTLARLLVARGELSQAAGLLERICQNAQRSGQGGWLLQARAGQARVYELQGQRGPALEALRQTLDLAEAEDYIQTFVEAGPAMAALLAAAAQTGIHPEFARHMLETWFEPLAEQPGSSGGPASVLPAVQPGRPAPKTMPGAPLSEREMEVLRLVAAGLSNKEIAVKLCISLRTVKFHTSAIYARLGVDSRMQAVRRARELEILPKD